MLPIIDANQRIEFSISTDQDPKTIFILKPLSGIQQFGLSRNLIRNENGTYTTTEDYASKLLNLAIVEIKNPDINDAYELEKYISNLNVSAVSELISKISEMTFVTEEERKNL